MALFGGRSLSDGRVFPDEAGTRTYYQRIQEEIKLLAQENNSQEALAKDASHATDKAAGALHRDTQSFRKRAGS